MNTQEERTQELINWLLAVLVASPSIGKNYMLDITSMEGGAVRVTLYPMTTEISTLNALDAITSGPEAKPH